jgi:hypothetical protein
MDEGVVYFSYLLRLWQVPTDGGYAWRVLLESVRTGEKCGFTSLKELMDYLGQVTAEDIVSTNKGSQTEVQV